MGQIYVQQLVARQCTRPQRSTALYLASVNNALTLQNNSKDMYDSSENRFSHVQQGKPCNPSGKKFFGMAIELLVTEQVQITRAVSALYMKKWETY